MKNSEKIGAAARSSCSREIGTTVN